MGVPGYSNHTYNYICLTFWTCGSGPTDTALLWNNPSSYIGTSSSFGSNDNEIRTNIKSLYNNAGIKLMVSAFGATEYPTSSGLNALQCATKLANYVTANQLDGVDIDWEDTAAFNSPTGGG
jgi:chitinase